MPAETAVAGAGVDGRELLRQAAAMLRSNYVRAAHRLYARALEVADDDGGRASALEGLGRVAHHSGRPREAVRLFDESLALLGLDVAERPALAELIGRSCGALGELERATAIFERCLQRARERGDAALRIRFASLVSFAQTDRGRFAEAEAGWARSSRPRRTSPIRSCSRGRSGPRRASAESRAGPRSRSGTRAVCRSSSPGLTKRSSSGSRTSSSPR